MRRAWPPLVPALAVPPLFLHVRYQPKVDLSLASTDVGIELSDVVVLAVVVAGIVAGVRGGWEPLRAARWLWLTGSSFLAVIVLATFHPLLWQDDYSFADHAVTAATFCEYALLAPAVALLVRRSDDALPLLWVVAGWSVVASAWGVLQFVGLVRDFDEVQPLRREPSFLGIHDFAALSAAALVIALGVLALNARQRALAVLAAVGGGVGVVLAGALSAAVGIALAGTSLLLIARRRGRLTRARGAAVVAACVAVALAVPVIRSSETTRLLRDLGLGSEPAATGTIESYGHRTLLAYIGVRIFVDHPLVGVGWQGAAERENYDPYLADARSRYPNAPPSAFPSPEHAWGTQNAYLQTLAETGVVGLAALVGLGISAVVLGAGAALRAPRRSLLPALIGLLWLLVAAGVWNGLGLVAGIPLAALTSLAFGLIAASAAWSADELAR